MSPVGIPRARIHALVGLSERQLNRRKCRVTESCEPGSRRLSTDDLFTLRRMAVRGIGIACLPTLFIADDLSSGALVRLLPSLSSRAGVVHAVFPSRRGMVPAVRALLDPLSEGFAAHPLLIGGESGHAVQPRR